MLLVLCEGIHRWLVVCPHKGPVTRKGFPCDDVIMWTEAEDARRTDGRPRRMHSVYELLPHVTHFERFSTMCKPRNGLTTGMHYSDVIMSTMASQITSLTIVYSTVYSGTDQRKYQSSASLAFVRGIHRGPLNSPHKESVTRKMLPFDDVPKQYM